MISNMGHDVAHHEVHSYFDAVCTSHQPNEGHSFAEDAELFTLRGSTLPSGTVSNSTLSFGMCMLCPCKGIRAYVTLTQNTPKPSSLRLRSGSKQMTSMAHTARATASLLPWRDETATVSDARQEMSLDVDNVNTSRLSRVDRPGARTMLAKQRRSQQYRKRRQRFAQRLERLQTLLQMAPDSRIGDSLEIAFHSIHNLLSKLQRARTESQL